MNIIVTILTIIGLILEIKNLFFEFKAPKLNPLKADKGMQGDKIFN